MHPATLPLALGLALLAAGCASPRLAAPAGGVAAVPARAVPLAEREAVWHRCRGEERAIEVVDATAYRAGIREETAEGEVERLNKVGLFIGYTWERGGESEERHEEEAGGGGLTVGLDYAREIGKGFAMAAFAEVVAGDLNAFVAGVGLEWRPNESLFFFAGPGLERAKGKAWTPLLRFAAGYYFRLGRGVEVGPALYVDLRPDETPAWVAGLNVGKRF